MLKSEDVGIKHIRHKYVKFLPSDLEHYTNNVA